MNTLRPLSAFLLTTLLLTSGCGDHSAPKSQSLTGHPLASPLIAKCEPGQVGGRLTICTVGFPQTFNPLLVEDGASDQVIRMIFGPLMVLDATTQEAGAGLAESWSVEPDGKTWTFKLRAGLRWSDGEPLTADDVVFTWNEIMYNPDMNQITFDLFRINGKSFDVSKVDELTVRVVTPEVFAPFLEYFGGVAIYPKHTIAQQVQERRFRSVFTSSTRPDKIVGCGPFRVKSVELGKSVLLERNPEYWVKDSKGQQLPYFNEVLITNIGIQGVTTAFLSGVGDVCEALKIADQEPLRSAPADGKFQLVDLGVGTERDFLWFNLNTNSGLSRPIVNPAKLKWFSNKTFRQAVSCAIDRDRIVKQVYNGHAQPILSFISEDSHKWYNTNVVRFPYDRTRARTLLAEIGIQDRNGDSTLEDASGNAIEFTLVSNTGNPTREKCAALIVEDLQKLGFKVNYQPISFQELVEKINGTFDYECVLMGLGGGGVDPASQINVLKSDQPLHQWFPMQQTPATDWEARIDVLMDLQMRTSNFPERKKYFDEVQAILAEQQPMIYTATPLHIAAARSNIGNLRPSLLTPYRLSWNIDQLYFKKQ